jgi:hypothetical protein
MATGALRRRTGRAGAVPGRRGGFSFSADGPFVGADLDDCRDPDSGVLAPWAAEILDRLPSYAEVSVSGRGVHVLARGRLDPRGPNRRERVEVYSSGRYFVTTGRKLPAHPSSVTDCGDAILRLQAGLRSASADRACPPPHGTATTTTGRGRHSGDPPGPARPAGGGFHGGDDELLCRVFAARNGQTVKALWEGRHDKPSPSEALLALAQHLAFWVGPSDPARLERLLVASPLYSATESERSKWGSPRRGGTWGSVCIVGKALSTCRSCYLPGPCSPDPCEAVGEGIRDQREGPEEDNPCVRHSSQLAPDRGSPRLTPRNAIGDALRLVEGGNVTPSLDVLSARRSDRRNALRRLAAVCWHLAGRRVGGRFRLSIEAAAGAFVVHCASPARWFLDLEAQGVIRRTVWGNTWTGLASEWKGLGVTARIQP